MILKKQSGNVLFIILIAVALFAALSFAFFDGTRGGKNFANEETAKLAAQEILSLMKDREQAFQALMLNGCSASQIDMGDLAVGTSGNAAAPTGDDTCTLDGANGGAIKQARYLAAYQDFANFAAQEATQSAKLFHHHAGNSTLRVEEIGGADNEFAMQFNFVRTEICTQYNNINGKDDIYFEDDDVYGDDAAQLSGKKTACIERDISGDRYNQIYYVYLAR